MSAAKLSESAFTTRVVDLAKLKGWRIFHALPGQARAGRWVTGTQGHVGFPDLIAVRGQRFLVAELKVGRNKPTPEQTAWLEGFMRVTRDVYLWRDTDWDEIVEVLA